MYVYIPLLFIVLISNLWWDPCNVMVHSRPVLIHVCSVGMANNELSPRDILGSIR